MKLFTLVNSLVYLGTNQTNMTNWIQILTAGLSSGTLITAFFLIRKISRLEMQVEIMWQAFERRYGTTLHRVKNERRAKYGE